jgi:hypothetical protein
MTLRTRTLALSAALAAFLALSATAQAAPPGFGIRGGLSEDPDTIFFGGHVGFDVIVPQLRLEPSAVLGLGLEDGVDYFTLWFNLNGKYRFPLPNGMFIYPLLGLSIMYINVDCEGFRGDCDDTELGLNLGGGIEFGQFFVDLHLTTDYPDFAVLLGYTF